MRPNFKKILDDNDKYFSFKTTKSLILNEITRNGFQDDKSINFKQIYALFNTDIKADIKTMSQLMFITSISSFLIIFILILAMFYLKNDGFKRFVSCILCCLFKRMISNLQDNIIQRNNIRSVRELSYIYRPNNANHSSITNNQEENLLPHSLANQENEIVLNMSNVNQSNEIESEQCHAKNCEYISKNKIDYRNHMKNHCATTNFGLRCNICNYGANEESEIKIHILESHKKHLSKYNQFKKV